jgi:hypothetical protein
MPLLKPPASGVSRRAVLGAVAALLLCLARPVPAQESQELPEYVLKAGFLYNFAKYVDWPVAAFDREDSPIVIGVAGRDPFGPDLEKTFQGKAVKGRAFLIERFAEPADIRRCHMLFVAKTDKARQSEILASASKWPVLTVGEEEGFARSGGVTSILIENAKPRLEVNPEAAEKAGLTISAKLLKAATVVRTDK